MPRAQPLPEAPTVAVIMVRPVVVFGDLLTAAERTGWRPSANEPYTTRAARADDAARIIEAAVIEAIGAQGLADRAVAPGRQEKVAQAVAKRAADLLAALDVDPDAAAAGRLLEDVPEAWRRHAEPEMPPVLAHLIGDLSAAIPPKRALTHGLLRLLDGARRFEALADARTDRDMPDGEAQASEPLTVTAEEAAALLARARPPTMAQRERGRVEAAAIAALMMLPEVLGVLLALARASAAEALRRDLRTGDRPDTFGPVVLRGIVRAYHATFGAWPKPHADNLAPEGPPPEPWARAVLQRIAARVASGAICTDVAGVGDRFAAIGNLSVPRLRDLLRDAVIAETRG